MDDKEMIDILEVNGVDRNISRILLVLLRCPDLTQKEIVERTGIRQPEVSIATAQAYQAGWIRHNIHKRENSAGRPYYRYALKKPFALIIEDIANDRAREIAKMMDVLRELKAVS